MNSVIRKSQSASATEAADLLAGIFSAELAAPSKCLWLVSPWISDVEIVDNSAGGLRRTRVGSESGASARRDPSNPRLPGYSRRRRNDHRCPQHAVPATPSNDRGGFSRQRQVHHLDRSVRKPPHEGADRRRYALAGSMNITFNGIQVREELVDFRTDETFVAQARMDAYDRFGGVL